MSAPHERLRRLLDEVRDGTLDVDGALAALTPEVRAAAVASDLGFATVDLERAERCGLPEVVFCPGKIPADAAAIAVEIVAGCGRVLLTRAEPAHAAAVRGALPDAQWHERARCLVVDRAPPTPAGGVAVVAAGTADLPVAEEAAVTLEFAGVRVERHFDVGVAGLHRLLARVPAIRRASCAVAVAGMEGALPSVLAGLLDRPVIAVPTSVGYGAHFGGLAPLLAMLNSCAAGVAVVNVDNGFGAGYLAAQIDRQTHPRSPER
ncbi:MAG: nickel pincer cofactor biosynthesis protein LarB [Planctomycetota bacterium]